METNKVFCVGIDLCKEFSQVTYFTTKENEPVSVDFSGLVQKYQIPTAVSKTIGKEEWFAGDDAVKSAKLGEAELVEDLLAKAAEKNPINVDDIVIMPIEILKIYLDYLLQIARMAGQSDYMDKVCITVEDFNISVLNIIKKAMNELGVDDDHLEILSHKEAYIHYVLNQKPEIWRGDVVLFDYNTSGLSVHRMYMAVERGNKIIMVNTDEFFEEVPYSLSENQLSVDLLDTRLKEAAKHAMERHNVTSVFLIGRGFGDDIKLPDFIKYVCDRKRVFAGQNLYAKGAAYAAAEGILVNKVRDYLLACSERITTGIEMKILDRGRDKILRMVKPGVNWFKADCSYDFIVDNATEMELFLSPVDAKDKQVVRLSLEDFPKRINKATRITVSLSFTSDSRCHLMIKDKGFGDFFASSGTTINEELLL